MSAEKLSLGQWMQVVLVGLVWSGGFLVFWFDFRDLRALGLLGIFALGELAFSSRGERRRWSEPVRMTGIVWLGFFLTAIVLVLFVLVSLWGSTFGFGTLMSRLELWLGLTLCACLVGLQVKRWRQRLLARNESKPRTDLADSAD